MAATAIRAFRHLGVLALLGLLAVVSATPTTAAEPRFFLSMALDGDCIGINGPARTTGTFTVRTPGGRLRAKLRFNTRAQGQHVVCPSIGGIHGGDLLRLRADDGWTRRWTVPRIRVSIDRARDVVSGTTDPGRTLSAETMEGLPFMNGVGETTGPHPIEVAPDGTFRLDLADVTDLTAQDVVFVSAEQPGLTVAAVVGVPFLVVQPATDLISGAGPAGRPVTVRLVRGGIVRGAAVAQSEPTGTFDAAFRDPDGDVVYPRPGDLLRMAIPGGPALRVPAAELRADARSDIAQGRCMPGARFELEVSDGYEVRGRTDADGRFVRDLSDVVDLRRRDGMELTCLFPQGDLFVVFARAR